MKSILAKVIWAFGHFLWDYLTGVIPIGIKEY